jgi:hypothetical protein
MRLGAVRRSLVTSSNLRLCIQFGQDTIWPILLEFLP